MIAVNSGYWRFEYSGYLLVAHDGRLSEHIFIAKLNEIKLKYAYLIIHRELLIGTQYILTANTP